MFAFDLAERLGCTVAELLARVDSRELSEWMAFERVRPITTAERQHAELMHLLASFMLGKSCPPISRFTPRRLAPPPPPEIPFEEQRAALHRAFARPPTAPES